MSSRSKRTAELDTPAAANGRRPRMPRFRSVTTDEGEKTTLSFDSREQDGVPALMEALGTADRDFALGIVKQAVEASPKAKLDQEDYNFRLAMIEGIAPRDEVEAALAVQMTATHCASVTLARRLGSVDTIEQQNSASNALNKLLRTYTMQMEALRRYRSGGQQNVRVEHVHVHDGGQAIVGAVSTGGRGGRRKTEPTS